VLLILSRMSLNLEFVVSDVSASGTLRAYYETNLSQCHLYEVSAYPVNVPMKFNQRVRFFSMTLASVTVACSAMSQSIDDSSLRTDQLTYHAKILHNPRSAVQLTIETEYTNTTENTVYFMGCHHPSAPQLQKYQEGKWVTVYSPIENLCLSPPWDIAPGETYRETYQVYGYLPGHNAAPTFDASIPGRYRLVRDIYQQLSDPLNESELLPLSERVSNEFTITNEAQLKK